MSEPSAPLQRQRAERRLRRRYAAERRFRLYGLVSIAAAMGVLALIFGSLAWQGYGAFLQTRMALDIVYDPAVIDPEGTRDPAALGAADYGRLVKDALQRRFADAATRQDRRALAALASGDAAFELRRRVLAEPALIGGAERLWLPAAGDVDMLAKGVIRRDGGHLSPRQVAWLDALAAEGRLERQVNWSFLAAGDSREPEQAGLYGALVGTILTMLATLVLSFPLGLATAVYLEEFAPRNRWTDLIEVNINNLAAVPSIIFGLLGLAIFLGLLHLPRSAPLVGGMVLALLALPTFIIAARAALQAVPPSIREAALAVGASPLQVVAHHVLPLALPGVLTGAIIGMARAAGESAPLLMIGMVAFIADVPQGLADPATVLPVQIYLWADAPERGFLEKTSAAILVMLAFLVAMNLLAVTLRRRFERRY